MATNNPLKVDTQKTYQELIEKRSQYTDEQAQQLGYPSAEVLRMEDHLSQLAATWRTTKEDGVVKDYQLLLCQMILKGYDIDELEAQDYLPERFMPELPPQKIQTMLVEAYREPVKS